MVLRLFGGLKRLIVTSVKPYNLKTPNPYETEQVTGLQKLNLIIVANLLLQLYSNLQTAITY